MPLLRAEPSLFPDHLLDERPGPVIPAHRWWALHTRPRAEKALARSLVRREIAFFLPLRERIWLCRGRRFRARLPLFPGYLFLFGDDEARGLALATGLAVRSLGVADQNQLRCDLQRVHRLIAAGLPLTPEDRLQPGAWVRIARGPLSGMEGRVLRRANRLRLLVEVHLIQQAVSVEVESWMVEAHAQMARPTSRPCAAPVQGAKAR